MTHKIKVLIVRNKGVSDSFLKHHKKKMEKYYIKDAPRAFGIDKIEFDFDEVETDIGVTFKSFGKNSKGNPVFASSNVKDELRKLNIIPEKKYHVTIFVYDVFDHPFYHMIRDKKIEGYIAPVTFWRGIHFDNEYVEIPTRCNKDTWTHEMVHAIGNILEKLGIKNILDEMDKSFIDTDKDGVKDTWQPYYFNNFPTKKGGNYDITLSKYNPHFNRLNDLIEMKAPVVVPPKTIPMVEYKGVKLPGKFIGNVYIPKYFKLREWFPPNIVKDFGDKAWEFLDARIVMNYDWLRHNLGVPIIMNDWEKFSYRGYDDGGFRKGNSQHKMGRAGDSHSPSISIAAMRKWIIENKARFPEPNFWLENGVNWIHMDVRYSVHLGMYLFNPNEE